MWWLWQVGCLYTPMSLSGKKKTLFFWGALATETENCDDNCLAVKDSRSILMFPLEKSLVYVGLSGDRDREIQGAY